MPCHQRISDTEGVVTLTYEKQECPSHSDNETAMLSIRSFVNLDNAIAKKCTKINIELNWEGGRVGVKMRYENARIANGTVPLIEGDNDIPYSNSEMYLSFVLVNPNRDTKCTIKYKLS